MIKIDKDIPAPAGRSSTRAGKYPFASMEVGDSFFFAGDEPRRMLSAAYGWGRRHGVKFRQSMLREDGNDGVRVWRVG